LWQEAVLGARLDAVTAHTLVDRVALGDELRRIRERGFADESGEYRVGVRARAVPLASGEGDVVAALAVSWSGGIDVTADEIERRLALSAGAISSSFARLGSG
jgi:DNA-binding IclR family transcriptional regulator